MKSFVSTYSPATEADTLLRVKNGTLPDERLNTASTTIDLVEGNLANDLAAELPVFGIRMCD
jgi:hypothetical protein